MVYGFTEYNPKLHAAGAGGKGSVLARLHQAGYRVPDGFIVPAEAFEQTGLRGECVEEVLQRHRELAAGGVNVAVRSSALAEDSAQASYAGEFESILNVDSPTALLAAIADVHGSQESERVARYSAHMNEAGEQAMAVVVQVMVDADYAGVLFTVEPVSQNRSLMIGSFVSGLGERLVAGEDTGQAFSIDRASLSYDGPDELDAAAGELARLALALEAELGAPQDIEWALRGDVVHVLQARPITTLSDDRAEWNSTLDNDFLWTNTNVGEAIGGVMSPYTWSIIQSAFDQLYKPPRGLSMMGNVGGHVYMNVSVLLAVAGRLGFSIKTVLATLEPVVGPMPEGLTIPRPKVGFFVAWAAAGRFLIRLVGILMRMNRHVSWAAAQSPAFCEALNRRADAVSSAARAMALIREIQNKADRDFGALVLISNIAVDHYEALKKRLARHLDAADVETLVSGLGGDGVLQSMAPMVALQQLADGRLSRDEFARAYGHRGPEEMELSKPRTAEDPQWIDRLSRQVRGQVDVTTLMERQSAARAEAWSRLEALLKPGQLRRLRRKAEVVAERARHREIVRSELVRLVGAARRLALRVAKLTGLGDDVFMLQQDEMERLLAGDEGQLQKIEPRKAAMTRYETLPALPNWISGAIDLDSWAADPRRRTDYHDSHREAEIADDTLIRGAPGAAGIVEGTVRVIASHLQADQLEAGEVLVASFTNVGWTPFFPKAAAVVTDVGAAVSHAAIVARELGIPAVVGTGVATMKLKTGDRVRVNGSAGLVERL